MAHNDKPSRWSRSLSFETIQRLVDGLPGGRIGSMDLSKAAAVELLGALIRDMWEDGRLHGGATHVRSSIPYGDFEELLQRFCGETAEGVHFGVFKTTGVPMRATEG